MRLPRSAEPLCEEGMLNVVLLAFFILNFAGRKWALAETLVINNGSSRSVIVQLNGDRSKHRISFVLVNADAKFLMVVTPCACQVEWTLSSGRYPPSDRRISNNLYEPLAGSRKWSDIDGPRRALLCRHVGRAQTEYSAESLASRFGLIHLRRVEGVQCSVQVAIASNVQWSLGELFPTRRVRTRLSPVQGTLTIGWDQSEAAAMVYDDNLEYEIVLSQLKVFETQCSVDQSASRISVASNKKCDVQISLLRPGMVLFISVFAISSSTLETVPLEGVSVVIPDIWADSNGRISDGEIVLGQLGPSQRSANIYLMNIEHMVPHLLITLQPCTGYLKASVHLNDQPLRHWLVEELKTVELFHVPPGLIRIRVSNDDDAAKSYKLWVSSNVSLYPYIRMPYDTSLFVLEHGRTCRSVRLGWLESAEAHSICLFKRRQLDDYFTHLILEEPNQCQGPASGSDLVFCRRLTRREDDNDYASTREVLGLRPASTYRFDLYASKPGGQTLPYRTVWVKTKQYC